MGTPEQPTACTSSTKMTASTLQVWGFAWLQRLSCEHRTLPFSPYEHGIMAFGYNQTKVCTLKLPLFVMA